jgi:hypothetical protein
MGLTALESGKSNTMLPPGLLEAVEKKVTDRPHLDAEGGQQPRYIVVQVVEPPKKGFWSSFWGKVTKTIGAIAVAAAIAATAFFGFENAKKQGAPLDRGPVAPVEQVQPRDPSLPTTDNSMPTRTTPDRNGSPNRTLPTR